MVIKQWNSKWAEDFQVIKNILVENVSNCLTVEHVGSTAIKGMYAKPELDIAIVTYNYKNFADIKLDLEILGYKHCGDQEIENREVFKRSKKAYDDDLDNIPHHLYVCPEYSKELKKSIMFRDYLSINSDAVDEFNAIKFAVLKEVGENNRAAYVEYLQKYYSWFFKKILDLSIASKFLKIC